MTTLQWQKVKRTKEPFDESERMSEKTGLKLNIQKIKIMASHPITSWQIEGRKVETVADFISWALKSLPHVQGEVAVQVQEGQEELLHVQVRRGGGEEIPLVQGKEQQLRFAEAAEKRYPKSKVKETQGRR